MPPSPFTGCPRQASEDGQPVLDTDGHARPSDRDIPFIAFRVVSDGHRVLRPGGRVTITAFRRGEGLDRRTAQRVIRTAASEIRVECRGEKTPWRLEFHWQ